MTWLRSRWTKFRNWYDRNRGEPPPNQRMGEGAPGGF